MEAAKRVTVTASRIRRLLSSEAMTSRRIGYVTVESAGDVRSWSGLNTHILSALRNAGLDAVVADNLAPPRAGWARAKARFYRHVLGQRYPIDRDPSVARQWAAEAARRLSRHGGVRTVVSPGTIPIAFLPDAYQTAIWVDATFHSLRTTYPGFERLSRKTVETGDRIERAAFQRSAFVCFASDWAAEDAMRYYDVPAHKVAVVPFGANCPAVFSDVAAAMEAIGIRSRSHCRLVFLGVDWERKGGPLMLEAARRLHDMGIPIHVSIVGCPRPRVELPSYVEFVGFLDKRDAVQQARWDALMRAAHFLIMPSIAECYGLAYAEASAYGVPSLARNVGGVSAVVRHGINGALFATTDGAEAYAAVVAELWNDSDAYVALALKSYEEWRVRLNWQTAGSAFVERFAQAVSA